MFSAQAGEESSSLSGRVVSFIQKLFFPDYGLLDAETYAIKLGELSFLTRKFAHFSEYLILGGLLSYHLTSFKGRAYFHFFISFLLGTLYAVTDEWHQLFVSGRSMQVFDMCVDAIGVLFGTLMLAGLYYAQNNS